MSQNQTFQLTVHHVKETTAQSFVALQQQHNLSDSAMLTLLVETYLAHQACVSITQVTELKQKARTASARLATLSEELKSYQRIFPTPPKALRTPFKESEISGKNRRRQDIQVLLTGGLNAVAGPNSSVDAIADFLTRSPEVSPALFPFSTYVATFSDEHIAILKVFDQVLQKSLHGEFHERLQRTLLELVNKDNTPLATCELLDNARGSVNVTGLSRFQNLTVSYSLLSFGNILAKQTNKQTTASNHPQLPDHGVNEKGFRESCCALVPYSSNT